MFSESLTFRRYGGILFNMNNWYIPIILNNYLQFYYSSCIHRMGDKPCIVLNFFVLSGVFTSLKDSKFSASQRLDLLRMASFCNSDNWIYSSWVVCLLLYHDLQMKPLVEKVKVVLRHCNNKEVKQWPRTEIPRILDIFAIIASEISLYSGNTFSYAIET